ncbi:MAG: hypothetical protein HY554_03430 [Elusimicrobia bacterium]|nr:hypothetical protein [Elusimicrobiota bacterium]
MTVSRAAAAPCRLIRLGLGLLALAAAAMPGFAALREVEVESKLTEDCTRLLEQLLGPGRAKVMIRVQGEQSEVRTQTEFILPSISSNAMPGFGVSPYLEKTVDLFQRDQEQSTRTNSFAIKRIEAFVVVDKSLPAGRVDGVRTILSDLLRIDAERGDTLNIVPAELAPAWRSAVFSPEGARIVLILAGGGVLLLVALIGLNVALVRPGRKTLELFAARRAEAEASGGLGPFPGAAGLGPPGAPAGLSPPAPPAPVQRLPRLVGQEGGALDAPLLTQRFSFLEGRRPEEVAELLQDEAPADLSLLLASLAETDATQASAIFSSFPAPTKVEVSRALLELKSADPERLAALESRLQGAVDYMMHGPDKLGSIVSLLPPEERDALMDSLGQVDPEAGAKLGRRLVTFEDLLGLGAPDLRRLLGDIPMPEWAAALQDLPPALAGRILDLLPDTTRELVTQEMERPKPRARVTAARSKIMAHAAALASEGAIDFQAVRRQPEPSR